jgi:hypothetical protein
MKKLALLFISAVVAATCLAQTGKPDDDAAAHAFDFWIGDWNIQQKILQKNGRWLAFDARTSVSPTLDGLALIEHWEGKVQFFWEGMREPKSIKGLSVRAYDPKSGKWYIYWMDTLRPYFGSGYSGGFENGRGQFFRAWEAPNGKRLGRITFRKISSSSVDWELAVSKDEGKNWSMLWTMHMVRRGERAGTGNTSAGVANHDRPAN